MDPEQLYDRFVERFVADGVTDVPEEWPAEVRRRCLFFLQIARTSGGRDTSMDSAATDSFDVPEQLERIGPYEIIEVLGEGGMGVVYLAEQLEPVRRQVAVKVIRPGMDTREVIARFEAERQVLAMMDHPAIAKVYDAGSTPDGRPYFVMQLVSGVPITVYCDAYRLDLRERLELFLQVCRGVDHAHQKGVIHRDIKPTNVLVARTDGKPLAKVIDFGVAKATAHAYGETVLQTQQGCAVGTPAYMSPEQSMGYSDDVDRRTDVYSLGVLLYELLVGELPLDWEGVPKFAFIEIVRRIREHEPPNPSVRWARLSLERTGELAKSRRTRSSAFARELREDIDWITMKAIEKQKARRYSTANAFAADVEAYLRGEPVSAGPPTTTYLLRKYATRHRRLLTAVGAVLLALTIGLIGTVWYATVAGNNAKTAQENASVAERRLTDIQQLSDQIRVERMGKRADELWPAVPAQIAALRTWLDDAAALTGRLVEHEEALESLQNTDSRTVEEDWELAQLKRLVADLRTFGGTGRHGGTVGSVEWRLEFSRTIEQRSLRDHELEWVDAVASIRDPVVCPRYAGLEIVPQLGLVPLGRDRVSGLWEFCDLGTGEPPKRDENGRIELTESSGVVLVLLPGGDFRLGATALGVDGRSVAGGFHVEGVRRGSVAERMGIEVADRIVSLSGHAVEGESGFRSAQLKVSPGDGLEVVLVRGGNERTLAAAWDSYLDPYAEGDESPVSQRTLEPFFLSKYEVTQAQWLRATGSNPSYFFPGNRVGSGDVSLLHPVEYVNWGDSRELLERAGLRLPTETEWEYAARAGTRTAWWTGNELASLKGAANLADATLAAANPPLTPQCELAIEDGAANHAPVGSYRANGFGLHDVAGNALEWCEDAYYVDAYGEGKHGSEKYRVARGGGWGFNAAFCRSADRAAFLATQPRQDLGLRAARTLVRSTTAENGRE